MVLATHGPDAAAVRAGQPFLGQGAWEDTAHVGTPSTLGRRESGRA
jgi:hypothetical protein